MSTKNIRKSNVISSDEEIDSEDNQMDEDLDDNNVERDNCGDSGGMTCNTGWADAINKVLSVKPKNKSIILSKAKKDKDIKRKSGQQNDSLELVKSDGTVVETNNKLKTNEINVKKKRKNKLSKNEWEVINKLKPKEEDKEMERLLCSIATKGVVQLFNAVREQQKTIETKVKEVGASETKRDKVMTQFSKNQFLDKLKQMDNSNKDNKKSNSESKQQKGDQKWKVLRDDFMIGAKMKDWDKQTDDSNEDSND